MSHILTKKTMKMPIIKETYCTHLGVRLTPTMMTRLRKVAELNNMPPAIFVRWVLFNYLDDIEQ